MAGALPQRSTTVRDRDRRTIARTKPPCALCGGEIDYSLKYPDPWCFVVDHIIPWNKGGADTLDNKQPAHNQCNREKWDKVAGDDSVTFVTARTW